MAAPKGNKYGLANYKAGQPPKYETPEELEKTAIEYFDMCTTSTGICKPTMSGLVFHLGYKSRQSLLDQKERSEAFSDLITRLRLFVESCYEANLHGFNYAGSIFALKNMNPEAWKDKTEVDNTHRTEQPMFPENPTK